MSPPVRSQLEPIMRLFAFVILSLLVGLTARAAPVDDLLARTLEAYGGDALPPQGTAVRFTGQTWSHQRGAAGATLREVRWPDLLRIEIAYEDGGSESRGLIGEEGWRDGQPSQQPMTDAMRLQAARLSLPMILAWERERLIDRGEATREDGVAVHRVAVDLGGGLALFAEIDRESARILRSAGVMSMGGTEMSFGTSYSDFQNFGALAWPAREDLTAMGMETGWATVESVEAGIEIDLDAIRP